MKFQEHHIMAFVHVSWVAIFDDTLMKVYEKYVEKISEKCINKCVYVKAQPIDY